MKKITKIFSILCAVLLMLCLASCKSAAEKRVLETYARAEKAFTEAVGLIRENGAFVDEDVLETVGNLEEIFGNYGKKLYEEELSDEEYDEMNEWFLKVEAWAEKARADISEVTG